MLATEDCRVMLSFFFCFIRIEISTYRIFIHFAVLLFNVRSQVAFKCGVITRNQSV